MAIFNIKAQAIPTVESAYADVIGTTDNQIIEIKNELLVEDNNQHFQIHDDTIEQLAERIAKDGHLSPCIVAPLPDGRYELIDGRHRRRAVIMAGLPTTKCIIKTNLSDQTKKTIRLTSNLIRNNDYLPSELAFAYKELAELEDLQTISEETKRSKKKIYRYIRLTNLIQPLLNRVDSGTIPVIAAVELSYLSREVQGTVFQYMLNNPSFKITTETARIIKFNGHSFPAVLEVIAENQRKETENDGVDNLSAGDDDFSEQTEETSTDSDTVSMPEKKASEHSNSTAAESSDSDTEEAANEDDRSDADNLSAQTQDTNPSGTGSFSVNRSLIVGKNDLIYQDSDGEAHYIEEMDGNVRKIICEYVIETTDMDYHIFRQAYDSKDILDDWDKNQIRSYHRQTVCEYMEGKYRVVGLAIWNASKRMFDIEIHGEHYIFLHKMLEKTVRRYIRETYTVERIISALENRRNN